MGTCLQFMAAWKSRYINCHTCRFWDRDELTCVNPEEIERREKVQALEEMERLMKRNKAVFLE